MQANVDNYLTLAEEKNDIWHLIKANSFRKTVQEKKTPLKISTRQLENWSGS